jgi:hypothetical protein
MSDITIDRAVVEQVLEALDSCDCEYSSAGQRQYFDERAIDAAVTALREALNAPQPEPVKREWVGLTVQEIADCWVQIWSVTPRSGIHEDGIVPHRFAYAIEEALKERNHE